MAPLGKGIHRPYVLTKFRENWSRQTDGQSYIELILIKFCFTQSFKKEGAKAATLYI